MRRNHTKRTKTGERGAGSWRGRIRAAVLLAVVWISMLVMLSARYADAAQAGSTQGRTAVRGRVDVNSADAKSLESLPGVGPVLAQRIVAGRPYRSFADLEKVKGLGKSKVAALQTQVVFGPAAGVSRQASGGTNASTVAKGAVPQSAPRMVSTNVSRTAPVTLTVTNKTATRQGETAARKVSSGEKININRATAEELERLPGIGPAKARAIIEHRGQKGDFKSIEDIQQVKGIKAGAFGKMRDSITVGE